MMRVFKCYKCLFNLFYNNFKGLDFNIIDPSVDFYILNLYNFLTCTPDMRVGGSAPLTGNSTYTVVFNYFFVTKMMYR